jgi:hypothetical protein
VIRGPLAIEQRVRVLLCHREDDRVHRSLPRIYQERDRRVLAR